MTTWPHDDTASKNAFYGNFQAKGWQDLNLTHYLPPFKMYYAKQPMVHGILIHHKIVPALTAVFTELWDGVHHDQAAIDHLGVSDFGGGFNIRRIAGSDNWSNHSWACALDLSPGTNGFGAGHGTIGLPVVAAFKRQGFLWGGDYRGRTDPMHFEAVSR